MDEEAKEQPICDSNDANYAEPTEASQAFVTFESDAENDDGDDEDSAGEGVDASDVRLPVPPEMRFDDDLVAAIGGMTNIAAGEVSDAFLTKMGEDGWSDLITQTPYDYLQQPYEPRPPRSLYADYSNLYNG
ncbi:hypothetical protein PHMEG_00021662, partial [Phytophthora megakarya]